MPKLKENQVPSYRIHKQSGQAIVTLSGKDHLLGNHGTQASRAEYDRLIGEWLANGRRQDYRRAEGLTIARILAEFVSHAKSYYRTPDGEPTGEYENFRVAIIPLKRLYAATVAAEFGPRALAALQQEMIKLGWSRTYINRQVGRIKQVFRWAASQELIPAEVYQALTTLPGLRKGKGKVRESAPVKPVPDAWVDATIPHISRQAGALVRLQLLTGMRSGEAVIIRGCDLDMSGKVWIYQPLRHKTEHHGHTREIRIGPAAQDVIRQFLKTDLQAYLFSPAEAEAERRAKLHEGRKTPLGSGNSIGTNVVRKPKRRPKARYMVNGYRLAIARGCDAAFPPPPHLARLKVQGGRGAKDRRWESKQEWRQRLGENWAELLKWREEHRWHPHQLRHNAATRLRRDFGIEAARIILGHRSAGITEIYAEADLAKATKIMAEVG